MNMLDTAISYAKRGWKVFPCQPALKIPFAGTHGVQEATDDEAMIRAWWTRWPTANIALACGKASGVYVVDIDVDDTTGKNGFDSCKDLDGIENATLAQRTPRGGLHALFKCSGTPPRNKNNFRAGVDIRSDGYYIMLSPSVHPNGGVYKWVNPDAELAEFPEAYKPAANAPVMPWDKPAPKAQAAQPSDVLERAIAYLDTCEPATQGLGGHDALLWAARALVVGFRLDEGTATNLLWTHYNPRCNPPWNPDDKHEKRDFERKVSEARKTPGTKPAGWLLDESNSLRNDESDMLLEVGREIAANLLKSRKQPETPQKQPSEAAVEATDDSACAWPNEILHPPGLVGEICDWINSSAGCDQPILALGAALTACGALFGRKVKDESNGRTNIYAMGVAHSSAGKDHPSTCIERLFHAAGASKMLGGQVTSDSAIELSLMEHMVKLYCWDEVGHIFANIKQAGGSGGNAHLRTIVPTLMQLYSSPHKLYVGKQRAEGEARRLDQPHTCIWGLTSPDVLYSSISKAELRDGWLGRVITFISHDRPKYKIVRDVPPPAALVSMVQAWFTRTVPAPEGTGNILGATSCYQITVPTSHEAYRVFEAFRDEAYEAMLAGDRAGDDCQFLWGKALQNARRIALTVSVGRRWDNAEISREDALYGCALIRCAIRNFAYAIERNIADSQWESDKQRLYKLIEATGTMGVSKCELTRKTQWIKDRKTRDAYLADMQDAGNIVFGNNPDKPDVKSGWLWTRKYGKKAIMARRIED
jgi:hypothetical protein